MSTETTDLDRSTRPGKWQKRGVQPEVAPRPPSPMERIRDLMDEIRLEKDPARKAVLERQFQEQCKAFDMVDSKSLPVDIYRLYEEIAESLALTDAGTITVPDNIGKPEWLAMHRALLEAKSKANHWLSQSRRYAVEKWGADYLAETEVQLELELGIEQREQVRRIGNDTAIPKIQGFARAWLRWQSEGGGVMAWDRERLRVAVESLKPVVESYQEMLARLEG